MLGAAMYELVRVGHFNASETRSHSSSRARRAAAPAAEPAVKPAAVSAAEPATAPSVHAHSRTSFARAHTVQRTQVTRVHRLLDRPDPLEIPMIK